MIFLARAGDVDGLSFWVLLGCFALLSGNWERYRTKEDMQSVSAASKRRMVNLQTEGLALIIMPAPSENAGCGFAPC